jgi:hypothetical protein
VLLTRLLRALAAVGFVKEVSPQTWSPTAVTEIMAQRSMQAGQIHAWDQCVNIMADTPRWLKKTKYKNPENAKECALQYACETNKTAWEFWASQEGVLQGWESFSEGVRNSRLGWVEWWPVQERVIEGASKDPEDVLLVDIAGGRGRDIETFAKKYPDVGRLVLQELPAVIDDVGALDRRIEKMQYDFSTPQPVKGKSRPNASKMIFAVAEHSRSPRILFSPSPP